MIPPGVDLAGANRVTTIAGEKTRPPSSSGELLESPGQQRHLPSGPESLEVSYSTQRPGVQCLEGAVDGGGFGPEADKELQAEGFGNDSQWHICFALFDLNFDDSILSEPKAALAQCKVGLCPFVILALDVLWYFAFPRIPSHYCLLTRHTLLAIHPGKELGICCWPIDSGV